MARSLFNGLIDEFRIYNLALTAGEVASSFTTGPDPAPLPVAVVNRDTGAISIANQSGSGIQLKGYSITSAGARKACNVDVIDAGDAFDNNGVWTTQSLTTTNITESVTGGTLDGGTLAASTSRGIRRPQPDPGRRRGVQLHAWRQLGAAAGLVPYVGGEVDARRQSTLTATVASTC